MGGTQPLAVPGQPVVAIFGRPPSPDGAVRRIVRCARTCRWSGRRGWIVAALDVVAAADPVQYRWGSRDDRHARHPLLVPAPGPASREVVTVPMESTPSD